MCLDDQRTVRGPACGREDTEVRRFPPLWRARGIGPQAREGFCFHPDLLLERYGWNATEASVGPVTGAPVSSGRVTRRSRRADSLCPEEPTRVSDPRGSPATAVVLTTTFSDFNLGAGNAVFESEIKGANSTLLK